MSKWRLKILDQTLLVAAGVVASASLTSAADFPTPYNSERDTNSAPLAPQAAAAAMQLPPGFTATVFASEPDVQNPIACAC